MTCVQVQTTSVCNGKCIICPYKDSWFAKNPGYMPDKLYKKILEDIADYDPTFFGKFCPYMCNEPFADKKIVQRTDLAREILHDPYLEISTNVLLTTRNQIDELVEVYRSHNWHGRVMLSFHGTSKESYERVMKLDYNDALEKAVYLIGKFDGRLPIYIHCAIASRDGKYVLSNKKEFEKYWNEMLDLRNLPKRNIYLYPLQFHTRAGNLISSEWNYDRIVREIGPDNPFDCPRVHGHLHVIYTGEVTGCCCDYGREIILGDLTKQSLKEVYDSKEWKDWVDMVQGKKESPKDFLCKRCTWPGG